MAILLATTAAAAAAAAAIIVRAGITPAFAGAAMVVDNVGRQPLQSARTVAAVAPPSPHRPVTPPPSAVALAATDTSPCCRPLLMAATPLLSCHPTSCHPSPSLCCLLPCCLSMCRPSPSSCRLSHCCPLPSSCRPSSCRPSPRRVSCRTAVVVPPVDVLPVAVPPLAVVVPPVVVPPVAVCCRVVIVPPITIVVPPVALLPLTRRRAARCHHRVTRHHRCAVTVEAIVK